jgi:hypothetical protein
VTVWIAVQDMIRDGVDTTAGYDFLGLHDKKS